LEYWPSKRSREGRDRREGDLKEGRIESSEEIFDPAREVEIVQDSADVPNDGWEHVSREEASEKRPKQHIWLKESGESQGRGLRPRRWLGRSLKLLL
jgi:hypothetical protein